MRFRVHSAMQYTFRCCGNIDDFTKKMIEKKEYLEYCMQNNLVFLKSLPNSIQYWLGRKKDLFTMMRQLGEPSVFLTMSANEIRWTHSLKTLHRIKNQYGNIVEDPIRKFSAADREKLVNDDAVTCCILESDLYYHAFTAITFVLPLREFLLVDHFLRVESQHRGSPHVHCLLWLLNVPNKTVSENMPQTIVLIEGLCAVDLKTIEDSEYATLGVTNGIQEIIVVVVYINPLVTYERIRKFLIKSLSRIVKDCRKSLIISGDFSWNLRDDAKSIGHCKVMTVKFQTMISQLRGVVRKNRNIQKTRKNVSFHVVGADLRSDHAGVFGGEKSKSREFCEFGNPEYLRK